MLRMLRSESSLVIARRPSILKVYFGTDFQLISLYVCNNRNNILFKMSEIFILFSCLLLRIKLYPTIEYMKNEVAPKFFLRIKNAESFVLLLFYN